MAHPASGTEGERGLVARRSCPGRVHERRAGACRSSFVPARRSRRPGAVASGDGHPTPAASRAALTEHHVSAAAPVPSERGLSCVRTRRRSCGRAL